MQGSGFIDGKPNVDLHTGTAQLQKNCRLTILKEGVFD
jgi:hypothetical protein